MNNQKECKKSCKFISIFLYKKNMFCFKQVCVHWMSLMKKQIIWKFQWLEILNQMQGKRLVYLYQYASCLYPLSSKFLAWNICHMCTCKPQYWCTIMCVCEKSLTPHELCYLGLFNFAHSNYFHVIVIFKRNPKKCWSVIPFFGTQIVSEPFIRKSLLNIHCHASNVDKCWKLLYCDNILSTLYMKLAFALSHCLTL